MRQLSNFIKDLLVAIGALSSIVTVLWAIFPSNFNNLAKTCPWALLACIILIAIGYAIFANRNKNKINLKLADKVNAAVFYGDLFEANEIIVIPVNEYFDTIVDDKVISSKTVHGMFIQKFFGGNEAELKSQLKKGLSQVEPIEVNTNRNCGNKKKYPLGTVCQVEINGKVFYLLALTRFNTNHRAEVKNSEYQRVLCDLLSYIEQHSQGRKVSMPLIGGGHSGVNLNKQKILEFILFSIALKDELTLINGIDVILHESVKEDINLASTEVLFKTIGS